MNNNRHLTQKKNKYKPTTQTISIRNSCKAKENDPLFLLKRWRLQRAASKHLFNFALHGLEKLCSGAIIHTNIYSILSMLLDFGSVLNLYQTLAGQWLSPGRGFPICIWIYIPLAKSVCTKINLASLPNSSLCPPHPAWIQKLPDLLLIIPSEVSINERLDITILGGGFCYIDRGYRSNDDLRGWGDGMVYAGGEMYAWKGEESSGVYI